MANFTTLSSSAGTSAIILNPVAKTTTVMLTQATTSSTGAVTVEMTLDDPSAILLGGPAVTWAALSSGVAMLTSAVGLSLVYTVLTPIGGVRINSTANNTSNTWTLKALQSVTA